MRAFIKIPYSQELEDMFWASNGQVVYHKTNSGKLLVFLQSVPRQFNHFITYELPPFYRRGDRVYMEINESLIVVRDSFVGRVVCCNDGEAIKPFRIGCLSTQGVESRAFFSFLPGQEITVVRVNWTKRRLAIHRFRLYHDQKYAWIMRTVLFRGLLPKTLPEYLGQYASAVRAAIDIGKLPNNIEPRFVIK